MSQVASLRGTPASPGPPGADSPLRLAILGLASRSIGADSASAQSTDSPLRDFFCLPGQEASTCRPTWLGMLFLAALSLLALAASWLLWTWVRKRRLRQLPEANSMSSGSLERAVLRVTHGEAGFDQDHSPGTSMPKASGGSPAWGQMHRPQAHRPLSTGVAAYDLELDAWAEAWTVPRFGILQRMSSSSTVLSSFASSFSSALVPPRIISNMNGVNLRSILKRPGSIPEHTERHTATRSFEMTELSTMPQHEDSAASALPRTLKQATANVRFREDASVFSVSVYSASTGTFMSDLEGRSTSRDTEDWEQFSARMRAWSAEVLGKKPNAAQRAEAEILASMLCGDREDSNSDLSLAEAGEMANQQPLCEGSSEIHEDNEDFEEPSVSMVLTGLASPALAQSQIVAEIVVAPPQVDGKKDNCDTVGPILVDSTPSTATPSDSIVSDISQRSSSDCSALADDAMLSFHERFYEQYGETLVKLAK